MTKDIVVHRNSASNNNSTHRPLENHSNGAILLLFSNKKSIFFDDITVGVISLYGWAVERSEQLNLLLATRTQGNRTRQHSKKLNTLASQTILHCICCHIRFEKGSFHHINRKVRWKASASNNRVF